MCGFITNNGTVYYIDSVNRQFWGGKFKNKQPYINVSVIIGCQGIINLADERVVTISIVRDYI